MDVQGYYGKQMLAFFLIGMVIIATNFFLMALGIWWAGHPWFQKI